MYHKVAPYSPTMWWVEVDEFYRQMSEISSKKVVFLDDYDSNNPDHVVITFDGIYLNILEYALPILKHFGYPFELFLTSDYLGKDNEFDKVEPNSTFTSKEELKLLVKGGGRLQWHTQSHVNLKNVKDSSIIDRELTVPNDILKLDHKGFKWFAYPHGEFNEVVVNEVKKHFLGAVSCNQGNDTDRYLLNRLTVVNATKLREATITCIIASYNYGDFLIEAIESVLNQTIKPDEILITDDCSDDDTQLVAEAYVKKYPELISYNRNTKNMGIVDHFNKAVSLTSGEYIFFLGADNRIVSNYIEECAKVLDSNPKIGIAYTNYSYFGSRAKLIYDKVRADRKGGIVLDTYYKVNFPVFDSDKELFEEMKKGNFIQGSSMYKRKAFNEISGYKKSSKAEDYNLFKRILEKGYIAKKANKTNLEYRQHSVDQANNLVGLKQKVILYKNLYETKSGFEKSKMYKLSYLFYRVYKKPKLIFNFFKKNKF